jgi:hypothetical protein
VYALVRLRPAAEREAVLEYWRQHRAEFTGPDWLLDEREDKDHLELEVSLSAEDSTGRRINGAGSFGIGFPRKGLAAIAHRYRGPKLSANPAEHAELLRRIYRAGPHDIEDHINKMLGRDPAQHRPSRLAWDSLIVALATTGLHTSEEELIEVPLTMALEEEVSAALDAP